LTNIVIEDEFRASRKRSSCSNLDRQHFPVLVSEIESLLDINLLHILISVVYYSFHSIREKCCSHSPSANCRT